MLLVGLWSLQGSSGVAFMNLADVWQPLLDGAVLVRLDCARLCSVAGVRGVGVVWWCF